MTDDDLSWVLRRKDLSPGAKLCYLLLRAQENAAPPVAALAVALGVTERQALTYLRQLKDAGLIEAARRAECRRANVYSFPPKPGPGKFRRDE